MKKPSREDRSILISGINPVIEALRSGKFGPEEVLLARSDRRGREIEELALGLRIRITRSTREDLDRLSSHTHHQGALLRISEYPYDQLEDILALSPPDRNTLVALDSIQDPHNLGAILRSACFLGAKGVIIPRDRSAPVTPTVIKTASGATAYIPVIQVTNLVRALKDLKDAGYWVVGLDLGGEASIYEADLPENICLVIGNEQKGIRRLVKTECDLLAHIPASGSLDSLNASAAAAVALAEIQRRRIGRKE